MEKPRIVFFGTPEPALIVLEAVFRADYPIAGIVSKPERAVGRKAEMTPTPVASWARDRNLPLILPQTQTEQPNRYRDPDQETRNILQLTPDLLLVADYTVKIPMSLVRSVKHGGLNVHPSLLPAYRGPAPVPWAIANGEENTGVTVVTLSQAFDSGAIVAQAREVITPRDTTETLLLRLFEKGAQLLLASLPLYLKNPEATFKPSVTSPSYYPRLKREDGFVNWENIKNAFDGVNADVYERKYRAFHPWPGLWTKIPTAQGEKRLKFLKVSIAAGKLVPDEVQFEGKTSVKLGGATDLINRIN